MREVLGWLAVAAVLLVAAFYLVPVGAIALIMGADSTPEDCLRADRDELVALVADARWAQSPPSSVERKPVVRGASQFYMGCRVELRFVTDDPRTEQARLTDWGERSGYEFPPGRTDEIRALGDGIVARLSVPVSEDELRVDVFVDEDVSLEAVRAFLEGLPSAVTDR